MKTWLRYHLRLETPSLPIPDFLLQPHYAPEAGLSFRTGDYGQSPKSSLGSLTLRVRQAPLSVNAWGTGYCTGVKAETRNPACSVSQENLKSAEAGKTTLRNWETLGKMWSLGAPVPLTQSQPPITICPRLQSLPEGLQTPTVLLLICPHFTNEKDSSGSMPSLVQEGPVSKPRAKVPITTATASHPLAKVESS